MVCIPDATEQELQGLQGQQTNQFTVYGQWVPQLLREIDTAHKKNMFLKKPVGPLGKMLIPVSPHCILVEVLRPVVGAEV